MNNLKIFATKTSSLKPVPPPRLIAWETTQACNLACHHCRAEAVCTPPPGELDTQAGRNLLEELAAWPPSPMVILSGGEPLMRPDILELAAYGHSLGLRMLLSTNGTVLDLPLARALKATGIARLSLSLDGPDAAGHDALRGVPGAYDRLLEGAAYLREAGLPFQINSTLTAVNLHQAEALTNRAADIGAVAHHIFLLVPVGRGEEYHEEHKPLSAEAYEEALRGLATREHQIPLEFKATCAPQYQRIVRQMKTGGELRGRGCLAGQGFAFISSMGEVRGCGYLDLPAGNLAEASFRDIYENSPLFQSLRDRKNYKSGCGDCEYWGVCGGCRARAKAAGDYLGPEPLCPYPSQRQSS